QQKRKGKITVGNETILLIDDELEILKLGKEMLQKFGYQVIIAETGEDGINKYAHNTVDLVILDIGMPGMGGIKCLQQLLSIDRKARVLISSGYSVNGRVEKALALGVKAFLAKPYTINELLEIMQAVLNGD
ncbi:MAG: response regulator, partial [Thermodesulfobacteriota bacterium]|nr:response regulator [Thermodesulfobacteriota bacterium]